MTRMQFCLMAALLSVTAGAVHAGTTTVTLVPAGATTVEPGGSLDFNVSAAHTAGDNQGLAFLVFDLQVTGPSAIVLGDQLTTSAVGPAVNFVEPLGFGSATGTPIGNDIVQIGGGQNTIGNDPNSEPFVPVPTGTPVTNVGHSGATPFIQGSLQIPAGAAAGDYTLSFRTGSVVANEMTQDAPTGDPPVYKVRAVQQVIATSQLVFTVGGGCTDTTPPQIVHASGTAGQTRPYSGYIEPRWDAHVPPNAPPVDRVTIVFSEPVFHTDGSALTAGNFSVAETGGGAAPTVTEITTADNTTVTVVLSRPITLQQWTTVVANVADANGCNQIVNQGNLGASNEPDRIDIGFLPSDIDQNGVAQPLDLLRFRQFLSGNCPQCPHILIGGTPEDFFDIDRNGTIQALDLLRYRQLVFGTAGATMPWNGETIGPRP